jgi:hypothetical protein
MPMHDWTLVEAGIFHAFHHRWISLFLERDECVPVPLELTYQIAFDVLPRRWRNVLEPPPRRGDAEMGTTAS